MCVECVGVVVSATVPLLSSRGGGYGYEIALAWDWACTMKVAGDGATECNGGTEVAAPHRPWLPLSPLLALDACCPQPASPQRLHHQLRRCIRRRDSTGVGLGVCDWGSGRRWRQ